MGETVVINRKRGQIDMPDKSYPTLVYTGPNGSYEDTTGFDTEESREAEMARTDELTLERMARRFPEGTKFEIQPED